MKEVHNIEELDDALRESGSRLVLLFKHSTTCPISFQALGELQSYLDQNADGVSVRLIIVQTAGDVSISAAARLGVTHESPQAILVRDSREIWNASHYGITSMSLDEAIRAAQT